MPQLLSKVEVDVTLPHLRGWTQQAKALTKDFQCNDFREALAFVNLIGEKAEEYEHHPDILLHGWNKVKLTLSTHSAGGLTDEDIRLAREIDAFAPRR